MDMMMNFSKQDQDVCMYTSRLLYKDETIETIESRSLFLTLDVSDMKKSDTLKLKVYEKMVEVLTDFDVVNPEDCFSMIIAGDVEKSKSGFSDPRILDDPKKPHYHAIICFDPTAWKDVDKNFDNIEFVLATYLSEIREVNFTKLDVGKDDIPKAFWMERYKKKKLTFTKYEYPLGNGISYVIKTDVNARGYQSKKYQPSVYPFDMNASDDDVRQANLLCERLLKSCKIKY